MLKILGLTFCFVLVATYLCTYPVLAQGQVRQRQDGTCLILVDGTASVDAPRLADALKRIREVVPVLANACTKVRTGVFSDEGGFVILNPPNPIPQAPVFMDCKSAAVNAVNLKDDPASGLPGVREFKQGESRYRCAEQNKALRINYQVELNEAISQIRSVIPENVKVKTGCTAIVGLIQHLVTLQPPPTIFVTTDGEETCTPGPIPRIRTPDGVRLVMFLVPRRGSINVEGPLALRRGDMWKIAMPGLILLPYTDISAETLNMFLAPAVSNGTTVKAR